MVHELNMRSIVEEDPEVPPGLDINNDDEASSIQRAHTPHHDETSDMFTQRTPSF